jgi:hypothetical protein
VPRGQLVMWAINMAKILNIKKKINNLAMWLCVTWPIGEVGSKSRG